MTFATNDTWDSQLVELETRDLSPYPWYDLVGGTVLRTIIDFVIDPTVSDLGVADAARDLTQILHLGYGLSDDDTPEQNEWDPNRPHAEFMWRYSWAEANWQRYAAGTNSGLSRFGGDSVVRSDVTQRRRIRENHQMFAFGHYFNRVSDDVGASMQIGYTGRLLVQLP